MGSLKARPAEKRHEQLTVADRLKVGVELCEDCCICRWNTIVVVNVVDSRSDADRDI